MKYAPRIPEERVPDAYVDAFMASDFRQAKIIIKKQMRAFPEDLWLCLLLSQTLYQMGDMKAALRVAREMFVALPRCPSARFQYGLCLEQAGRDLTRPRYTREAVGVLKPPLSIGPKKLTRSCCELDIAEAKTLKNDARFASALANWGLGNIQQARDEMGLYLRKLGDGRYSRNTLDYVLMEWESLTG